MIKKVVYSKVSLFKDRNFLYFCLSGFTSNFGRGLSYICLSWLAYSLTNSVSGVAMMMIALWVPNIIFAPWIGGIVDRSIKKNVIMISNMGRGLIFILISLFSQMYEGFNIYFLVFIFGILLSFYFPSVVALVSKVIPQEKFVEANSVIDMAYELGTIVGAASSGFCIYLYGELQTILIGGFVFILSAALTYKIDFVETLEQSPNEDSYFKQSLETIKYINSDESLRSTVLNQISLNYVFMIIPILEVTYVKDVLVAEAQVFSFIEASFSLGIFLGCMFISEIKNRFGMFESLSILIILMGISFVVLGQNQSILVSILINFLLGIGSASWALTLSHCQLLSKIDFQGKILSLVSSISGLGMLTTYLLITIFPEAVSTKVIFATLGIFYVLKGSFILYKNIIVKPIGKNI